MNEQVAARVDDDLHERVAEVCERYDITESALIRHCLKNGLETIETAGLDAIVQHESESPSA